MSTKSPLDATATYAKVTMNVAAHLDAQRDDRLADLASGAAWIAFSEAIRDMGAEMLKSEFAESEQERAEGYRYLLGLLVMRIKRILYHCGPDRPAFLRLMDDVCKFGLDNPDGINSKQAEISEEYDYRLFGHTGGERYVEFVQSGERGTLSNHFLDDFDIEPDGSFEISLSKEPRPGNWMPLVEGARGLLVRQIQYDWEKEGHSEVHIERLGAEGAFDCLRTPDPARVTAELRAAGETLLSEFKFWQDYTRIFRREGDNVIPQDQPLAFSGHSKVRAAPKCFFVLEPDEAMLIEMDDPGGLFWSVAVGDTWFRSIDPSHRHSSLNGAQARRDADGRYRIVIAHNDPGSFNWLDTDGHRRGNLTFRYVRTERRPLVTLSVAPLTDIISRLPADTTRISPTERAEVIARRAAAYARRYADPPTTRWTRFEKAVERLEGAAGALRMP